MIAWPFQRTVVKWTRLFDAIFLATQPAEIYKQRKNLPWLENRWQFLVKSLSYTFPIRVNENQTPFTTNLFTLSSSSLNAKVALKVLPKNIRAQILSTFQTGSIRKKVFKMKEAEMATISTLENRKRKLRVSSSESTWYKLIN